MQLWKLFKICVELQILPPIKFPSGNLKLLVGMVNWSQQVCDADANAGQDLHLVLFHIWLKMTFSVVVADTEPGAVAGSQRSITLEAKKYWMQ